MWIMLNNAFISVVAVRGDVDGGNLLVRARVKGDIVRALGQTYGIAEGKELIVETETPDADYRFRAVVPRHALNWALEDEISQIDYINFKDSVQERDRHDAYLRCWTAMMNFQEDRIRVRTKAAVRPAAKRARKRAA